MDDDTKRNIDLLAKNTLKEQIKDGFYIKGNTFDMSKEERKSFMVNETSK
jgi:hypothetical protein